jgi:hypothetical protein
MYLAIVFCTSAAIAQEAPPQAEQDWFTYYYINKDISKVPAFLGELERSKRLDKHPESVPSVEGFLSVIFADNPSNVDGWIHGAAFTGKTKTAVDYAAKPPVAPDAIEIKNATDLDRVWGAYFASGDEKYLKKVEGVLEKTGKKFAVLHAAAAYSLGVNMTEHESVDRFLHNESAGRTDAVGNDIKQIVAGVDKQREARAFPNRDGEFNALMFITDPTVPAKTSGDVIHFKESSHAKAGDNRALVIVFAGMQLSPDYLADVTYDVKITDPAGKTFTEQKGLEAVKRKLPTRFRVFNNKDVVFLKFDAKDTPGEYVVNATLNDNIGKKSIPLTYKLTLEK